MDLSRLTDGELDAYAASVDAEIAAANDWGVPADDALDRGDEVVAEWGRRRALARASRLPAGAETGVTS